MRKSGRKQLEVQLKVVPGIVLKVHKRINDLIYGLKQVVIRPQPKDGMEGSDVPPSGGKREEVGRSYTSEST